VRFLKDKKHTRDPKPSVQWFRSLVLNLSHVTAIAKKSCQKVFKISEV
jgi:hypothetical protein